MTTPLTLIVIVALQTHAPVHLAPWKDGVSGLNGNQRVIVVTRNPNDAAVSMWHHSLDIPQFKVITPSRELVQHWCIVFPPLS